MTEIPKDLAAFIAREAITQPYRQVDVLNTREFDGWLSKRGMRLGTDSLVDLWKMGVLHPIAVLEPALTSMDRSRFVRVDLGYDVPSYVDLGATPTDCLIRRPIRDFPPSAVLDSLLWHPFQLFEIHWLMRCLHFNASPIAPLYGPDGFDRLASDLGKQIEQHVREFASHKDHHEFLRVLAVLVAAEPLVHTDLDRRVRTHPTAGETFDEYFHWVDTYDHAIIEYRSGLTPERLEEWHNKLSTQGWLVDPLEDWRILVRHASLEKRARLKDTALAAEDLYYCAEVIRRYLERYCNCVLLEEDDVRHGPASQDVKERFFGSRRTVDFDRSVFRRIARSFDLDPQARTTWLFEGSTEGGFIHRVAERLHIDLVRAGIEVVNLNGLGGLHSDRVLVMLERFQREEIFPFVTIDLDKDPTGPNLLRHYASQDLLPAGYRVWDPDFEQANFTLDELAGTATALAREDGVEVNVTGQAIGEEMEAHNLPAGRAVKRILRRDHYYQGKSARWGAALADCAFEHSLPSSIGENGKRPMLKYFEALLRGQTSNYQTTVSTTKVDPNGELIPR